MMPAWLWLSPQCAPPLAQTAELKRLADERSAQQPVRCPLARSSAASQHHRAATHPLPVPSTPLPPPLTSQPLRSLHNAVRSSQAAPRSPVPGQLLRAACRVMPRPSQRRCPALTVERSVLLCNVIRCALLPIRFCPSVWRCAMSHCAAELRLALRCAWPCSACMNWRPRWRRWTGCCTTSTPRLPCCRHASHSGMHPVVPQHTALYRKA